jgi:GNAT superfamily N-acetyltransferase
MTVAIREEPLGRIDEHARIPISVRVERILLPVGDDKRPDEITLVEAVQDRPYVKDYDAIEGNHPTDWPRRFDTSTWTLLAAHREGQRVGGIVLAHATEGVDQLEGRPDLVHIWDLRVSPEARRRGVGSALLVEAERWARARGCRRLKVETQNINLPACRFYARCGFELSAVNRRAYPELPDEIQLLWSKRLA